MSSGQSTHEPQPSAPASQPIAEGVLLSDTAAGPDPACPASATHPLVATSMLMAFLAGSWLLWRFRPFAEVVPAALALMGLTALGVYLPDLLWQRIWRRPSAALSQRPPQSSWRRTGTKAVGLLGSLGFVGLIYWLFPEYAGGASFYQHYWKMLRLILPWWLLLAVPYLYWVDAHLAQPEDNLWLFGRVLLGRGRGVPGRAIGQHLLGWLIKAFFLPLMFTYLCQNLGVLYRYDVRSLSTLRGLYDFLYNFLFYIDVGLVAMTYLLSLRVTDSHIRSSEPSLLGWVVALACYYPFWGLIGNQYLRYETGTTWSAWLNNEPVFGPLWGAAIIGLLGIYVWATVAFGGRFSNLTHRGIITSGPYRYTKHPAYWSKNLSWWLISVPFLVTDTLGNTLRRCALLLLLNGVYYLRAKTEERHLSLDPVYVQYAQWIDRHGLLRWLNSWPLVGRLARLRLTFSKQGSGEAGTAARV